LQHLPYLEGAGVWQMVADPASGPNILSDPSFESNAIYNTQALGLAAAASLNMSLVAPNLVTFGQCMGLSHFQV